jgi:DNA polymerase-3 subunit beta
VIVPRKGVIELMRMLDGGDNPLTVQIGSNNIRAHVGDFIFTSKLVDGRFPDYRRVLPKNPDKHLDAGCDIQAGFCPCRHSLEREIPRRASVCQRKPVENHR